MKNCSYQIITTTNNQHPTFYRLDALPVAPPTVTKHSVLFLLINVFKIDKGPENGH